jgi:hypothetical protein
MKSKHFFWVFPDFCRQSPSTRIAEIIVRSRLPDQKDLLEGLTYLHVGLEGCYLERPGEDLGWDEGDRIHREDLPTDYDKWELYDQFTTIDAHIRILSRDGD